jgi:hypothetical protein
MIAKQYQKCSSSSATNKDVFSAWDLYFLVLKTANDYTSYYKRIKGDNYCIMLYKEKQLKRDLLELCLPHIAYDGYLIYQTIADFSICHESQVPLPLQTTSHGSEGHIIVLKKVH